ncbi:isoprenylcysteine carboxylmethyltransferase family protein [Legionella anisa]|uniref:Isoprenylcysteine carboxylmethyltransferase family protein n=1 Tax=Legionella anisa TaxID=28082 RepID=A0AAX0WWW0_9GAMM|nr:isoprenylcysteine carboxylmethyltransferase family protein [Legionella anisa]AWN72382.1 isoprenylcysteine carboxylmethyltransferase family protein [Legionella anisa]KTC69079.1 putative S-isoprenylcysteine methyltransferase [Legionella anisa]MBN5937021.1 isoprenylcysteine carboxylmethyltransferase family protein [Legionella anisa]MCW8423136.1 isoprenylcysteine carboxylmethyltransferase family protein [Legionella anisa]MCW8447776.1 isoprenylcysteine carboxylmethyltransferase family protein [L
MEHSNAYGLWFLVIVNSAIFILFAFSFTRFKTKRDWKSFGAFSAFVIAYFTEMYGFPLTIYLLSGWLANYYPGINLYSHDSGHLLHTLLGLKGDPHFDLLHILSNLFILGGLYLIYSGWSTLYAAQKNNQLATTGLYAYVRHPQYDGFILVMIGFLLQWPTLITLVMFPILVYVYVHLARREEKDTLAEFGEAYQRYADKTPAFLPHLFSKQSTKGDAS